MANDWTSLSVRKDVYEKVKARKRGGETFNELLQRLCEQDEEADNDVSG
ncbi:antitoxin VapB family protein [Salinigranum rubrum]|nr:antitoxin VapB family protein [Salinigranum rubrum]